jgi:hypothetical protein
MAPHLGLEKIAWLGLTKKPKIAGYCSTYVKEYIQKLRTRFSVFLRNIFSKFG